MGLSAFWTAIKRPRVSEAPCPPPKHVDYSYDHHHNHRRPNESSPALETGDSSPHHLDAIYDTHHHILPASKGGPKRHPSSPPRIHSPTTSKPAKRGSLWKSHSVSVKPHPASDDIQPTKTVEKRRSFWRSDSKASKAPASPAVRPPHNVSTSWSGPETKGIAYEDTHLLAGATPIKEKRSSLRLSLRRTVSSKSSKNRLSWLAGGAVDSDDEDIPALPPIPTNLKREQLRAQDPGRHFGMTDNTYVPPGTAITSNDLYSIPRLVAKPKPSNRQSLTSIITNRKSATNLEQLRQETKDSTSNSNKRKRRSWFSTHSPTETTLPPMPPLPNASDSENSTVDPSELAFHRFLHNSHHTRPQGVATDYERFLAASHAYDQSVSVSSPTHLLSHSTTRSTAHTSLPTGPAPPIALHPALKRSTYSAPKARRSRASNCRPSVSQDESNKENFDAAGRPFLTAEQQHEWNKLRVLLDDTIKTVSPTSSLEDDDDDDGVLGMVRELSREEDREARFHAEKSRRDREYGYGTWRNDDALARLEFGR
ncbi:hypothetical protein Q7P37_011129 [Cladosporium fusiforme]